MRHCDVWTTIRVPVSPLEELAFAANRIRVSTPRLLDRPVVKYLQLELYGICSTTQRRRGVSMTSREFEVDTVLKAADEWVSAQEALLAAQQAGKETETEREAVDSAGSRLVVAVTRWRSSRRS
jgi:hypothetical protein